jgi:hypothetical protein
LSLVLKTSGAAKGVPTGRINVLSCVVNVSGATVKRPIWSRRLPTHIMAAIQRSDDTSGPETLGEANENFQKKCDAWKMWAKLEELP